MASSPPPRGRLPEADSILIPKERADEAIDAAAYNGCGACVTAYPKGIEIAHIARLNREFVLAPG